MSTSAIDRKCVKLALYDLLFAAVTALGGFVYEQFSHGVYSGFMVYAFLPPLVLGSCPLLILALRGKVLPGRWCVRLYHWGIIALTVGCLFQGALEIYGTTSRLVMGYWIAGGACLAGSLVTGGKK